MLVGYFIHDLSPYLVEFGGGFGVRWYGLAYVAAFLSGWWLLKRLARMGYGELKEEQVADFITWAALLGVLAGGRLGYALFYKPAEFLSDPLSLLRLWEGGMASHGGIVGLMIFTWFYARHHQISWRGLGDNLVVVAPFGLMLGRLANFINGELYGRPTSVPWAVQFPKELYDATWPDLIDRVVERCSSVDSAYRTLDAVVERIPRPDGVDQVLSEVLAPRHPSQLYEAFLEGAVLFAILWWVRTRMTVGRGVLTGLFFVLYAVLRMIGEQFREPDAAMTGPLTRGQFLSLFLIAIGAAFLWTAQRPSHSPEANRRPTQ